MTRPKIIDAFPFNNELDILEMRLVELYDSVDHFVLVESKQDHQDHAKPLWYADNRERFAPWADKIVHVVTGQMPTKADDDDPWAREHSQREWIGAGLESIGVSDDDIVMQSDVDEIPRALHARNVRPGGELWTFEQRGHFWAVDYLYGPWYGTTVCTVRTLGKFAQTPFAYMRDCRLTARVPDHLRDAGWHFSWLGGPDAAIKKVGSFCHPEVEDRIVNGLASNQFYEQGIHVDGVKMTPVDVNDEWPKWIRDGHAPQSWFRPR